VESQSKAHLTDFDDSVPISCRRLRRRYDDSQQQANYDQTESSHVPSF
jgi:hypothetical protein